MFQFDKQFGVSLLSTICAGLDAAAEALDMTPEELSAEFRTGKTLAQIAVAKGIDPTMVQHTVKTVTKAGPKAVIQQAVADSLLTREHAEWLLHGLEKDYWGGGQLWSTPPQRRDDVALNVAHWRQSESLVAQH